jgi:hypothetical protein
MSDTPSAVDWAAELTFQTELRDLVLGDGTSNVDAARLSVINSQRLLIAAGTGESRDAAAGAASEAAASGAAATLASAVSSGEVILRWPDGMQRHVSVDAPPFGPSAWLSAVSCALIVRDGAALEILCEREHIAAVQLAEHLADPCWPFLCTAVAAIVRQPGAASHWLDEAEQLLSPERVSRGDPDVIRLRIMPLVPILRALATDNGDPNGAFAQAVESHRQYFASAGRPADPNRLLPLDVTGLAALAFDRGRQFALDNLPAWLVRGEFERRHVDVIYDYGLRRSDHRDDATAFLDLEGFSRANREHTIVERGDQLVARYTVRDGPGVPRARVDFLLPGKQSPEAPNEVERALDAGERALLAEAYAKRASTADAAGDSAGARSCLRQAVDQIDAVLAAIPRGGSVVPEAEFTTRRGRQLRAADPGRFRRDRLTAYREALAKHAASRPPITPADQQFRANALVAAEVLKESVRPLLTLFAKDHSGQTRALMRPRAEDYEKVFEPAATDVARATYEKLWATEPDIDIPTAAQSQLLIHVAPGGMLREPNEISRYFPGGYLHISRWLRPERVWVAWKYVRPGEDSGLAYDGLVWCDDHWSWFPKPYRALESLVRSD